jgi:signal transduction histidine kinase
MPLDGQRLAEELHDGVVQDLSALLLQLETFERRLKANPRSAHGDLERIRGQIRGTLKSLRDLIGRLRSGA